jgi:hypothetical protein
MNLGLAGAVAARSIRSVAKRNKKARLRMSKVEERILKLTKEGDYGLCPPPMDAQIALNELSRYFLGEDWYTSMPLPQSQVNTLIVYEIENKYKRR